MATAMEKALLRFRSGDWRGAEKALAPILARAPRHPGALDLMGLALLARGRSREAIAHLKRATAAAPTEASFHEHLADALRRDQRLEQAGAACAKALALSPGRATSLNLMGMIQLDRGDLDAALQNFTAALRANPRSVDALINASMVLNRSGRYEQAVKACEAALALKPEHPLPLTNLGMAFKGLRRLGDAERAFERASAHPPARFNRGFIHMLRGELDRGLPLLEERKVILGLGRGLGRPEWTGAPMPDRRLLVIAEQGLGDTLLMSRFFPALKERFAAVRVQVQPPLARLMAASFPNIELVTEVDKRGFDCWCAIMSLPYRLGIESVEQIPLEPWIRPESFGDQSNAKESGGPLRVGLNWAGNPAYAYDAVRSTSLESLSTFLAVPGVEWVSLHKGHREEEAVAYGLSRPLEHVADFLDTARVVAKLDLVISTETAIPNLSAAMGIPTCVLTSPDVDWRWLHWYRDVTICEQTVVGNWFGPVARALEVIRDKVAERSTRSGPDSVPNAA